MGSSATRKHKRCGVTKRVPGVRILKYKQKKGKPLTYITFDLAQLPKKTGAFGPPGWTVGDVADFMCLAPKVVLFRILNWLADNEKQKALVGPVVDSLYAEFLKDMEAFAQARQTLVTENRPEFQQEIKDITKVGIETLGTLGTTTFTLAGFKAETDFGLQLTHMTTYLTGWSDTPTPWMVGREFTGDVYEYRYRGRIPWTGGGHTPCGTGVCKSLAGPWSLGARGLVYVQYEKKEYRTILAKVYGTGKKRRPGWRIPPHDTYSRLKVLHERIEPSQSDLSTIVAYRERGQKFFAGYLKTASAAAGRLRWLGDFFWLLAWYGWTGSEGISAWNRSRLLRMASSSKSMASTVETSVGEWIPTWINDNVFRRQAEESAATLFDTLFAQDGLLKAYKEIRDPKVISVLQSSNANDLSDFVEYLASFLTRACLALLDSPKYGEQVCERLGIINERPPPQKPIYYALPKKPNILTVFFEDAWKKANEAVEKKEEEDSGPPLVSIALRQAAQKAPLMWLTMVNRGTQVLVSRQSTPADLAESEWAYKTRLLSDTNTNTLETAMEAQTRAELADRLKTARVAASEHLPPVDPPKVKKTFNSTDDGREKKLARWARDEGYVQLYKNDAQVKAALGIPKQNKKHPDLIAVRKAGSAMVGGKRVYRLHVLVGDSKGKTEVPKALQQIETGMEYLLQTLTQKGKQPIQGGAERLPQLSSDLRARLRELLNLGPDEVLDLNPHKIKKRGVVFLEVGADLENLGVVIRERGIYKKNAYHHSVWPNEPTAVRPELAQHGGVQVVLESETNGVLVRGDHGLDRTDQPKGKSKVARAREDLNPGRDRVLGSGEEGRLVVPDGETPGSRGVTESELKAMVENGTLPERLQTAQQDLAQATADVQSKMPVEQVHMLLGSRGGQVTLSVFSLWGTWAALDDLRRNNFGLRWAWLDLINGGAGTLQTASQAAKQTLLTRNLVIKRVTQGMTGKVASRVLLPFALLDAPKSWLQYADAASKPPTNKLVQEADLALAGATSSTLMAAGSLAGVLGSNAWAGALGMIGLVGVLAATGLALLINDLDPNIKKDETAARGGAMAKAVADSFMKDIAGWLEGKKDAKLNPFRLRGLKKILAEAGLESSLQALKLDLIAPWPLPGLVPWAEIDAIAPTTNTKIKEDLKKTLVSKLGIQAPVAEQDVVKRLMGRKKSKYRPKKHPKSEPM